jgi:tRNA-dihydrouridine synthase
MNNNFWQDLPKPFFVLAPMEAVTDVVFRHVVARAAAPDAYMTEFTNAASFCSLKGEASTRSRLAFTQDEQPMVAQIWGTNPEHFATMSKALAKRGFAGIDINMGCPEKNIVKKGSCAGLIANPSLAAELIKATKSGGLPVSVKTRIGLKTIQTEQWCGFLLRQNLAALTVHGRTQKEMSKVPAHWDEIGKVVKLRDQLAPETVVIGNGDVENRQHGEQLAQKYGLDGIMIGRGVFHNPFAFEKQPKDHTKEELLGLLNFHLDLFDQHQPRKFDPLKRFFKIYICDFPGASELRAKLMRTKTTAEARLVLETEVLPSFQSF